MKKYQDTWQIKRDSDLSYIKKHPDSYVSLMLLTYLVGRLENDLLDDLYPKLSDKIKNSSLGYGFLEYYSKYNKAIGQEYPFDKIKLGENAPDFIINQTKNDRLTLADFKGSFVLLEFWELSCLPCLQANPLLEKLRIHYSERDFKVIAVNSTPVNELPKLTSYIQKNKLSKWIHVSINDESKKIKNSMVGDFNRYHNIGVPRSILIDKNGKVIYKNLGYSPDEIQNLYSLIDTTIK